MSGRKEAMSEWKRRLKREQLKLHPEAIEYIVNELKNSNSIVIATTHSPAVVDIVDPEDLILFEKDRESKTVVKRVKNAGSVKRWLAEQSSMAKYSKILVFTEDIYGKDFFRGFVSINAKGVIKQKLRCMWKYTYLKA